MQDCAGAVHSSLRKLISLHKLISRVADAKQSVLHQDTQNLRRSWSSDAQRICADAYPICAITEPYGQQFYASPSSTPECSKTPGCTSAPEVSAAHSSRGSETLQIHFLRTGHEAGTACRSETRPYRRSGCARPAPSMHRRAAAPCPRSALAGLEIDHEQHEIANA